MSGARKKSSANIANSDGNHVIYDDYYMKHFLFLPQVSEAINVYKKYAKIPNDIDGRIILSHQDDIFNISSIKTLRNLEESSKSRVAVNYTVAQNQDEVKVLSKFPPLEISSESVYFLSTVFLK